VVEAAATPRVTAAALDQIGSEWQALARDVACAVPFDFPAWHRVWWSHFSAGRTPVYLGAHDGDALVAIAPLMQDGDTLTLAGDPEICDYTSFPLGADGARVLPELLAAIDRLPWHTFHLWGLPEDASALAAVQEWAVERGYDAELDFEAVCPRVDLPGDWETYLASLKKKDRHELRRKLRRFADLGADTGIRTLRSRAEIEPALAVFFHLHRVSRHDKSEFMTAEMEGFFREMVLALADDGIARLYLVEVDRTPVAALIGFVPGDELLLYNSGYDPAYAHASVGLVSKALTLRAAIDEGLRVFDFLRGAEPYKYDLGASDRIVRQLWVRRHDLA
jgi:CelD/BcsL family acetyltransferase involved in cellulose biosynthesis